MNNLRKRVLSSVKPLGSIDLNLMYSVPSGLEPVVGTDFKRFLALGKRRTRDGMGEAIPILSIKRIGASLLSADLLKVWAVNTPQIKQEDLLYYNSPVFQKALNVMWLHPRRRRSGLGELVDA